MRCIVWCLLVVQHAATVTAQISKSCTPDVILRQPFTVQTAADAAKLGGVAACPGKALVVVWAGKVQLASTIAVGAGSSLTITGAQGAGISGGGTVQLFENFGTLTLNDLALIDGLAAPSAVAGGFADGGGIQARPNSVTKISGCMFAGHAADRGAAIASRGIMDISGSLFADCTAELVAGAIWASNSSTVAVSNSRFVKNAATGGGAISAAGSLTITSCQFDGNGAVLPANGQPHTEPSGGAISFMHQVNDALPQLVVVNSSFTDNVAAVRGGAIASKGAFTLAHCDFRNNSVAQFNGGALYARIDATVAVPTIQPTVYNCTFVDNTVAQAAQGSGGAVCLDGFTQAPVLIDEVSTVVTHTCIVILTHYHI
jgi:predicted outer membrane repeat protein